MGFDNSPPPSYSYFKKTVTLHDWWLIKPETDYDDTKALGVAGITCNSHQNRTVAARCFTSAPISKVFDIIELETVDNVCIILQGFINKDRTLQSGFSPEVFKHFVFGFPVYWEEFSASCPKRGSVAKCVSLGKIASVHEDVFHDCDSYTVDPEFKDCEDTFSSDQTNTVHKASSPEVPPEHIVNTGDEVSCEKSSMMLEFEDDPCLVMNPISIDVDGMKHNVVKNAVDSSKCLAVSSRRMTRSMRKTDSSKNEPLLSHDISSFDKVTLIDPKNIASSDILRKGKNADLSNNKAVDVVDFDVMSENMEIILKVSNGCGKESNGTASWSEDMVRSKRQQDQNVDVTEEDIRSKLASQVGQKENKEYTNKLSGDSQIDTGRSDLGVIRFKSVRSESSTTSVGCQVNASSIEDFNHAFSVPDVNDDPKANMKACQNKKKNKKEIPAAHRIDSKKAIMTRSKSKSKVTPHCEMAKRQPPITTPKSTSRANKDVIVYSSKDPYGSANIVSPEDFSGKKSRSGRVLLPSLEFWRNQKVVYDKDHQVYGIQEPT